MADRGTGDNFGDDDGGDDQPYGIKDILSAKDMEIMAWHFHDGRSYAEIAVLLSITKQSIHERVVRASKLLASHGYPIPEHPKPFHPTHRQPLHPEQYGTDIDDIGPAPNRRSDRLRAIRKRIRQPDA